MNCTKCKKELVLLRPSYTMVHLGTDYWTLNGERRYKPTICMECRSELGKHAKKEQDKQIVKAETDKHVKILNNILQGL